MEGRQGNKRMRARINKLTATRIEILIQGRSEPVYWEVPADMALNLKAAKRADFLAIAAFPFAMRAGTDLIVEGSVDRELARNLAQFSIAWSQYRPEIFKRPVRLMAGSYRDRVRAKSRPAGFACAYSGGVDSAFVMSLGRERAGMEEFPPVSLAVMIDGFGFDLGKPENFERTYAAGRTYCARLGVPLTRVRTNWSKMLGAYQLMHTIGIAAVLHLLSDKVAGGYIGMDFTYDEEFELGPWGNSAMTSRLFSSADFPVVPAGGERSRVGKLHSLILNGDAAYLTVCNNPERSLKNCGRCEKCQRTMLAYRSLGIEPERGQFEHALELESVRELSVVKPTRWVFYNRMAAQWKNKEDPYLAEVRNLISRATDEGCSLKHERTFSQTAEPGLDGNPLPIARSGLARLLGRFGLAWDT